ncbi:MAG TPA: lysylphosphatidylglycerol synthase transmembrane domain-containing protein [Elusimicrobiales bacterium]|nr:lysylphosphatidylglycerol synthase transmembrane domain-containing protein [Elusimicrobiales bacterium]
MKPDSLRKSLPVYGPAALSLGILIWLVYPNLGAMAETIGNSRPGWLLLSGCFAVSSYIFMGLTLWEVLRIMGISLPFREVSGIALVSTTVNYFVSSAGISGFATRAHLLGKRGVPYGASVTSSVVITVLIYLALAFIVIEGSVLRFLHAPAFDRGMLETLAGVCIVLGFAFGLTLLFFHNELRAVWARRLFLAANRVIFFFSRKEIPRENFDKFERQLDEGIQTIHGRKYELPKVVGYVFCDWVSNMLILYFAFKAVGVSLATATLVAGFAFGMLMTIIPILPGGLGAMEAAMTAAFTGMGVATAQALTASLLFRLFYYLLPAFASVFVYWQLRSSEAVPAEPGRPHSRHKGHHDRKIHGQ